MQGGAFAIQGLYPKCIPKCIPNFSKVHSRLRPSGVFYFLSVAGQTIDGLNRGLQRLGCGGLVGLDALREKPLCLGSHSAEGDATMVDDEKRAELQRPRAWLASRPISARCLPDVAHDNVLHGCEAAVYLDDLGHGSDWYDDCLHDVPLSPGSPIRYSPEASASCFGMTAAEAPGAEKSTSPREARTRSPSDPAWRDLCENS